MAKTIEEKGITKIFKKIKQKMEQLGVYRSQFDETLKVYAEMKYQYNVINIQFYKNGCKIVEEYTNKAGATNMRKSAIYLAIETMRKDLIYYENQLGLTPVSIKKINDTIIENKKESHLVKMIAICEKENNFGKIN